MYMTARTRAAAIIATVLAAAVAAGAQTHGEPERFTAIAIANDEFGSGAGRVLIDVNRWSTDAERERLVTTLREEGSRALLDELRDMRRVGSIRTPDSLAYDLHYAYQTPGEDGGRDIVIATDRPISFWEQASQARTLDYPFLVVQMHIGPDGTGSGTISYATKIRAYGDVIELENFSIAPIRLTEIRAEKDDE